MSEYYDNVGTYYDEDAREFDDRYWANPVLQRIRQDFREHLNRLPFRDALEVGCGTGLDAVHLGTIFPGRRVHAIDVSEKMVHFTRERIARSGLQNVQAEVASADDAPRIAGPDGVDVCYVFFGALNTVEDLPAAIDALYDATRPGGYLLLSFVNRWYLAGTTINLLRGRWKAAFRRLAPTWGGYSATRHLESRCYGPEHIRAACGARGKLVMRRGYSILYPAWFGLQWQRKLGRRALGLLWNVDAVLTRTPAWCLGEYALYLYRKD